MARQEQVREDLLSEGTAFRQRISLRLGSADEPTFVGFRADDRASFYFGASIVYHFTAAGELRGAFVGELIFKVAGKQLVSLRRVRQSGVVELYSHELSADEERDFRQDMRARLQLLEGALTLGDYTLLGQIPAEVDVAARVSGWLRQIARLG
jgi:hypothetical protein